MTSKLEAPSSKGFKDITNMILQDNENSVHKVQKESKKDISNKDKEIYCLKEHSKKLLAQIKKLKNKKQANQKLEESNQHLENNFFQKDAEISHIRILNQRLFIQIKSLGTKK